MKWLGDGGPATAALMNSAQNVSVDPAGDIYVTDGNNNHLREVTSATAPTITPAPGLTSALFPAPGGGQVTSGPGRSLASRATGMAGWVTGSQGLPVRAVVMASRR